MALVRTVRWLLQRPSFATLAGSSPSLLRYPSSTSSLEETTQSVNPYLKKYEDKIKAAKASGKKRDIAPKEKHPIQPTPLSSKPSNPKPTSKASSSIPNAPGLDSIMKIDKLEAHDSETIANLWNEYHSTKEDRLSGVMKVDFYDKLKARGKLYPMFVIPLPRGTGFEFFYLQFQGNQIYFTSLLELQTKKEHARPLLVLTHYTELADSKGIVLMAGEIDSSQGAAVLSSKEAQNLVYQLQMFYVTGSESKLKLVEKFHHEPRDFQYEDILNELDTLA